MQIGPEHDQRRKNLVELEGLVPTDYLVKPLNGYADRHHQGISRTPTEYFEKITVN
jgi:hypothetical protein